MLTIVLFRDDLRLHDHPALWHAAQNGQVLAAYIAPTITHQPTAENAWHHYALADLAASLKNKNCQLVIRQGHVIEETLKLVEESGCDAVYWHNRYSQEQQQEDEELKQALTAKGVQSQSFEGTLLLPPNQVLNGKQTLYQVFTPFWKRYQGETIPAPYPAPEQIEGYNELPSDNIYDLGLLDTINWHGPMLSHWHIGEQAAIKQWLEFREELIYHYSVDRDFPSKMNISMLSPHLACGSISARALWASGQSMIQTQTDSAKRAEIESFLRQLVWREFSYYQLYHNPTVASTPLRKEFLAFPWENNEVVFNDWKKGQTGYPLVDAGMRELWATGFMHNRVRMVTASFLIKHLLTDWTKGYEWFKETLVDFNMANNAMGWQWVAGTGVDAAPYFRVFNPILQSEKFDELGDYIRKWVPELRLLPNDYIHEPWKAPSYILSQANIELGQTYPFPIIDHQFARKRALAAYDKVKNKQS